jgi:type II secretory pathway pseudopilin PulG
MKEPLYWLFTLAPRGWIYQNMVIDAEFIQRGVDSYDAKSGLVLPRMAIKASQDIQTLPRWAPGTFLVSIALPNYIRATQNAALNQTKANEAMAACALERYRLVHGRHPETLEMLIPDFLKKLPRDIINGQPLHYRVTDHGRFLLYSVGWNEIDDHGVVSENKGGSQNLNQGDWVWQQDASGI